MMLLRGVFGGECDSAGGNVEVVTVSGVEIGLLCQRAMLCRAIGALTSENGIAGFELPIRKVT